jgi:hypothetical protein
MATKLITKGNQMFSDYCPCEFLCDTDADLNNLPVASVGSTAVSIESGLVMVVNTSGNWVAFGG